LRQLNDLFGAALSDPASRLRLTLALCWNVPGSLPVGSAR
jgi:hypothetical protein